jgi:hypothetical protein
MMTMHSPTARRSVHADRLARLRFDLEAGRRRPSRRPVRRWVGHQLVRFGARLAGDPVRWRPVRSH